MAQPTLPVKPAALHGRVSLRHARRQVDPASVARLIRCANIANNGKSLYHLPVWFVGQLRFRTAKPVQPTFFVASGHGEASVASSSSLREPAPPCEQGQVRSETTSNLLMIRDYVGFAIYRVAALDKAWHSLLHSRSDKWTHKANSDKDVAETRLING